MTWLLPRSSVWNAAAVGHDRLWRVEVPSGRWSYRQADRWLVDQLRELDVAFWRRWVVWAGVRLGALTKGRQARRDVARDLPRLAGVVLVMGPVIVPPAAVVMLGLLGLWLVDSATWLVGRLVGLKPRNRPSLLVRP